jgi:tetratricopeptide (TPR) repeat protein
LRLTWSCRSLLPTLIILSSILCIGAQTKPDPAEAARLNNIGVALMNQQVMEKGVGKFDEALRKDPSFSTAELNKGIALLNLQKLPEAEQALQHASAAQPKNPRTWFNLGLLHRNQGRNDLAVEDLKKVLALDPQDPDSHYLLGSFYQQLQQYALAIPEFEAALKLNPLHASAEFGLARSLQRSGRIDEARVHLKTFEHLTREKISSPMTLGYGEQGRYSSAQDVITNQPSVGPMIPVTLVAKDIGSSSAKNTSPDDLGGGICLLDVNADGKPDLIILRDGNSALQIFVNQGAGSFKETPAEPFGLAIKGKGISCAVGDYDNDGLADLAVALEDRILLFKNEGNGKFADTTKSAGMQPLNKPAGLTFADYDHDGDLDLFVTGTKVANGTNVVWRNNGNGSFAEWTAQTGTAGEGSTTSAVLSDINNDRAVDLVVAGAKPTVYFNQREGKFLPSPIFAESLSPATGVVVFDFNKDGLMDIAFTHGGAPGISLWKNVDGKKFERVSLPVDAKRGWGITSVDIDNDGWIDLAGVVETARGAEVKVLRNLGERGFADISKDLGLDKVQFKQPRSLVAADVDRKGAADLIVTQTGGPGLLLRNNGGNRNHSMRLSVVGLADNKSGIGTKVEIFADGLWQKFEVVGASGYLSQGANEILVGLGQNQRADIVRMLWPTGVLQDELDVALDKPVSFTELDRRGSSCPTLFAWNGKKYEFVSDVIGAAVIGHWISPTEKNTADPDEWLKIDGRQLQPKAGKFSLRFGEPMEEVNFVDQVRLVAVDHPSGTEVYPNERFLSAPPFPAERVMVSAAPHLPAGAWDDGGQDVLALISKRDHRYVRDFKNISFAGYANMHSLTLDIGQWSNRAPLRMYMQGFIEYFTATSMYAAWQAGIDPIAPYLEAQMPDGTWKRILDDMGFPAGLPRAIVVDLTGKLPIGTRRIRISTNLQIYWDQILLDNGPDGAKFRTTELPLSGSSLAFRGYPQQVDGKTPGDLTYNYEKVSMTGPFSRQRGTYTRYGDVTDLLKAVDDHYVIFGSGEDIDLEFSASPLPPLPQGWKRDYFFYANGYVKDMDFYEALPFTVSELPFRNMTAYPYSEREHYPDGAADVEYRLEWNDRFDSGKGVAGYGFHYEDRWP